MFLVLIISIIVVICALVFVYYFSHKTLSMSRFKSIIVDKSKDFNEFKSNFYKYEWERDINHKSLLTNMNFYSDKKINYISTILVIVDNVKYSFSLLSYIGIEYLC